MTTPPIAAPSDMVAAVIKVLKDMADGTLEGVPEKAEWRDIAPPFIAAVLDNLPREAMRQAVHLFGITYGSTDAIIDAVIAAAKKEVLGQ